MSERCKRMRERTSEWPSTYVRILGCFEPLCVGRLEGKMGGQREFFSVRGDGQREFVFFRGDGQREFFSSRSDAGSEAIEDEARIDGVIDGESSHAGNRGRGRRGGGFLLVVLLSFLLLLVRPVIPTAECARVAGGYHRNKMATERRKSQDVNEETARGIELLKEKCQVEKKNDFLFWWR